MDTPGSSRVVSGTAARKTRALRCGARAASMCGAGSTGGEERNPHGPIALRYVVFSAQQLGNGGRNQRNNLRLRIMHLQPIDHLFSCLLGCGIAEDKYIDVGNRSHSAHGGVVVRNRKDLMAKTPEQRIPGARSSVIVVRDLKNDLLH